MPDFRCGPAAFLLAIGGALDPKESVSVPIGAGDLLGDGRKGFVRLPVPFKTVGYGGDDMRLVPPLPDHLGARSDLSGDAGGVWIAAAHGSGDLAKAPLRRIRKAAIGFDLHLICDGPRQEFAAQGQGCRVAKERFPAVPELVEAEIRQTPDLGLKGLSLI